MRQFLTGLAVVGLSLFAIENAQAGGKGRSGSHCVPNYPSYRYCAPVIWCNPGFDYGLYGVGSLNYTVQSWNDTYGCYQYWNPATSSWYFYVPTYSRFIPSRFYSAVLRPVQPGLGIQTPGLATTPVPPTGPVGPPQPPMATSTVPPTTTTGPVGPPSPPAS